MRAASTSHLMEIIQWIKEASKLFIEPQFCGSRSRIVAGEGTNIVTTADISVSNYLLSRIRHIFPGSYSEEELPNSEHARTENDLYLIDPIDGTAEFDNGAFAGVAVLAALIRKEVRDGTKVFIPAAGAIYLPFSKKCLYMDESGEINLEQNGEVTDLPRLQQRDVVRASYRELDRDEKLIQFYQTHLARHFGKKIEVIPGGGAGASFVDLFEGKIDLAIFPRRDSKQWDLAMAAPMIEQQRGFICDLYGREFTDYNREDYYNHFGYVASLVYRKDQVVIPALVGILPPEENGSYDHG